MFLKGNFSTSANLLVATRKPLANGFFEESLTPGTLGRSLEHIRFDGEGPTPVLSAFKPSEDLGGIILRVYNPTNTDWKGRIHSDLDLERVHECSMLENVRRKKLDLKNLKLGEVQVEMVNQCLLGRLRSTLQLVVLF